MERILVAMSGGVDSAVAAFLLIRRGFEVEGATFRLWRQTGDNSADIEDAKEVCRQLGIRHHTLDYGEAFRELVVGPFVETYEAGQTPNPCIICNQKIKFGAFLRSARELGFDKIATGHYARIERRENGRFRLRRAAAVKKDQSYFLHGLTQEQLAAALLPLGEYDKEQVREIAREEGLAVSRKADSQDVCFIPGGDTGAFLKSCAASSPGDFLDEMGNVVGRHLGICHYTVGQRKGLGVSFGKPVFVRSIDAAANTVTLSDNEDLFSDSLFAEEINWIDIAEPERPVRVHASIRNAHKPAPATVTPTASGGALVLFDEPQRAIAPGQSVVFYDGEYVVGGGRIAGEPKL